MTNHKLSKHQLSKQVFLATFCSLGAMATGLVRGFSSPGIPNMEVISPWMLPDESARSWIISIPPLGACIGSLAAMPWMHFMGRKRVLQIAGPMFALGWIGIALSNSPYLLAFFRACTGLGAGVTVPAAQLYVSECCDPKIRGLLGSFPSVLMVGGVMVQFLLGAALNWRSMSWVSAVVPALLLLVLIPFPESPPWQKLNKKKGASKAFRWYGIDSDNQNKMQSDSSQKLKEEPTIKKESIISRGVLLPLWLGMSIIFYQQACGNDVITYHTVDILVSGGYQTNAFAASSIFGVVHLVFVILSIFVVDKVGRKSLLIISGAGMGISMGCLSAYFYLHEANLTTNFSFVPLAGIMVYISAYSIGFCTIPLILIGELYPLAYRSILGGLTASFGLLCMFIELKTYYNLTSYFGKQGAFAVYSIMNFVAILHIYFQLPETKGKSLEDIEIYFSKKNIRHKLEENL